MFRREDHPLTAMLVVQNGRIPKVTVDLAPQEGWGIGRLARRRPYWLARDGQWAVQHMGCHQFLKSSGRSYPIVFVWGVRDYENWDNEFRSTLPHGERPSG